MRRIAESGAVSAAEILAWLDRRRSNSASDVASRLRDGRGYGSQVDRASRTNDGGDNACCERRGVDIDESRLRAVERSTHSYERGAPRADHVSHPIRVDAVDGNDDDALTGAEREDRSHVRSPRRSTGVMDDRQRWQPARKDPHYRVREPAVEPGKRPRYRHVLSRTAVRLDAGESAEPRC